MPERDLNVIEVVECERAFLSSSREEKRRPRGLEIIDTLLGVGLSLAGEPTYRLKRPPCG